MAKLREPLVYFAFFKYAPTIQELWTFYPQKIAFETFKTAVEQLLRQKKLVGRGGRVALPQNSSFLKTSIKKAKTAANKLADKAWLLKMLGLLPWVNFLGISGSVAANNARDKDDIDIFVITAKNRLWLARFMLITVASLFRIRRRPGDKKYQDKFCFNLFFSENGLKIRRAKQTTYVAHEVLQLKPVVNKNKTYERFLFENRWVFKFFPNAKTATKSLFYKAKVLPKKQKSNFGDLLEEAAKKFQLWLINRHKTKEVISPSQLWFFPDDFERRFAK